MEDLSRFLPQLIHNLDSREELREQAAMGAWSRIVGPVVAQHCLPFRLFDRRLIVRVSDRIWKAQMGKISGEILAKLNLLLGPGSVRFLEYRVDPGVLAEGRSKPAEPPEGSLPFRVRRELRDAAAQIEDREIRDLYLRAATRYLSRQPQR